MIKNIIFDFDGVLVDSEIIIAKALSKYLQNRNIDFNENDFSQLAGNKTVNIISDLSSKFNISDKDKFFKDIMQMSQFIFKST